MEKTIEKNNTSLRTVLREENLIKEGEERMENINNTSNFNFRLPKVEKEVSIKLYNPEDCEGCLLANIDNDSQIEQINNKRRKAINDFIQNYNANLQDRIGEEMIVIRSYNFYQYFEILRFENVEEYEKHKEEDRDYSYINPSSVDYDIIYQFKEEDEEYININRLENIEVEFVPISDKQYKYLKLTEVLKSEEIELCKNNNYFYMIDRYGELRHFDQSGLIEEINELLEDNEIETLSFTDEWLQLNEDDFDILQSFMKSIDNEISIEIENKYNRPIPLYMDFLYITGNYFYSEEGVWYCAGDEKDTVEWANNISQEDEKEESEKFVNDVKRVIKEFKDLQVQKAIISLLNINPLLSLKEVKNRLEINTARFNSYIHQEIKRRKKNESEEMKKVS